MGPMPDRAEETAADESATVVELLPVPVQRTETARLGDVAPPVPAARPALPAVQAAAVAAGGFLAGAAVVGVAGRRRRARRQPAPARRLLRRSGGRGVSSGAGEVLQIVASRSLLVDVHLLGLPGTER
jgi:hypothetical protein